jgi:predicted ATPase
LGKVVVIAGANGAGKSTVAPAVLRNALLVNEFVNADTIATGLSAFSPEAVAVTAGRIMLERIRELARGMRDFAFETTLAAGHLRLGSESFRARVIISNLYTCGYQPSSLLLPGSLSVCAEGATRSRRISFGGAMTEV